VITGTLISPPIEVPDAAVRALLHRWFPGQDPIGERMRSGGSTPVYRVTIGETVTYLRLAEEPGERRVAEVRVHEMLREWGVPVPRVLRFDTEPPELDRSAALTAAIPGRPIDRHTPVTAARQVARQAGRDLAAINAVPVEGFGWVDHVDGDDLHLVAEHRTRAAWAAEYLRATETVITAGILDGTLSGALRASIRTWADQPDHGWSRLAHGDFDSTHIYADPQTHAYTGIIDFGEIRGGDPLYDLGHVWMHAAGTFGTAFFEHLLAGYRDVPDDWRGQIRLQSIAIATRALVIQLGRPNNAYRRMLTGRLRPLLDAFVLSP